MAYGSFGSGDMYWFTSAAWSTPRISNEPAINNPLPDEHQPSCFGLEEERGGSWKGSGGTVPSIKEAKPSL